MIGIYGGTFNPIHQGHLRAAEEVVEALGLECMLFVPSARPPHKDEIGEDVIAPAKLRLEWVTRAVEGNPRFRVDAIEVDRPGPSYLVDTLRTLAARWPDGDLVFTVGQDAFAEMGTWREPRNLFRLVNIAVTTRPPVTRGCLEDWLPDVVRGDFALSTDGGSARHHETGSWIRLLPITQLDISASEIRQRLRAGRSVRYLLPEDVREAIEVCGCYNPDPRNEVEARRSVGTGRA
jgi:nicotinate-nucleotide adenylyltransferase